MTMKTIRFFMAGLLAGAVFAAPAWAKKTVMEAQLVETVAATSEDTFDRNLIWLHEESSEQAGERNRRIASDDHERVAVPVRLSSVVDKL
jgi:hypothetical protein